MKSVSLLIKPSSGSCNIDCSYCFYKDLEESGDVPNKGRMSSSTMKNLIDNVLVDLDRGDLVQFDFQGGEPSLLGLEFYQDFVQYVKDVNKNNIKIRYSFQTNGILLDHKWARFFKENNFLVGLSLDGPREIHDRYRKSYKGKGTYEEVMKAKELLEENQVEYNILTVLTESLARKGELMWDFIKEHNIRFIQFIPCLDKMKDQSRSEYSLKPESFAFFYKTIFPLWREDLYQGDYYSIGLMDELINLLGNHPAVSCALKGVCSPQYVVEADGSLYPCDFYVLERYKLGNINKATIKEVFHHGNMDEFIFNKAGPSNYCRACKYRPICNGGCKRLKNAMYLNQEQDFCGYQSFLESSISDLTRITRVLLGN